MGNNMIQSSSFIVVSYFTLDTPYQEVANKYLIPSLQVLDPPIENQVLGVLNLGSWRANTNFKPYFILAMLEKQPKNVLFVDCDAEILSYPELFENIPQQYNFAAHRLDRGVWYQNGEIKYELLTGTLWVRNCDRSKEIIKEWIEECSKSTIWEQKVLEQVLYSNKEFVYNLPIEYCWISSLPSGKEPYVKPKGPIIIRHNQVSRTLKQLIK